MHRSSSDDTHNATKVGRNTHIYWKTACIELIRDGDSDDTGKNPFSINEAILDHTGRIDYDYVSPRAKDLWDVYVCVCVCAGRLV